MSHSVIYLCLFYKFITRDKNEAITIIIKCINSVAD